MVEREIDISKKRWSRFMEMIREELPECIIDTLDNGRKERYWRIRLRRKIESTEVLVILKLRRKLMTHPEVDYENCFSRGIEETKRILNTPIPQRDFYGTILIDDKEPFFDFRNGGVSDDDEW